MKTNDICELCSKKDSGGYPTQVRIINARGSNIIFVDINDDEAEETSQDAYQALTSKEFAKLYKPKPLPSKGKPPSQVHVSEWLIKADSILGTLHYKLLACNATGKLTLDQISRDDYEEDLELL